jgi:hypothetical protein
MNRVSSLLAMAGVTGGAEWFYTEAGQERGHAVHIIGEEAFAKREIVVSPEYAGYATAVTRARDALGIIVIGLEQRLFDRSRNYSGRPDVIGYLPRPVGKIPAAAVIADLKSGDPMASHALQLGFYEMLAEANPEIRKRLPEKYNRLPFQRIGIYVKANGSYKIKHYTDFNDRHVCNAILNLAAWRQRNGLFSSTSDGDGSREPDDDPFTLPSGHVQDGNRGSEDPV